MADNVHHTVASAPRQLPLPARAAGHATPQKATEQERRRRELLALQRQPQSFDQLLLLHRLAADDWSEDTDPLPASDAVAGNEQLLRPGQRYRRQLMLAEWLLSVPADLEDNYLLKLCPLGQRVLVVAAGGRTRLHDVEGRLVTASFSSALPGGGRSVAGRPTDPRRIVLDGVLVPTERTVYLLDVMGWDVTPLWRCDAAFRFDWLRSQLQPESASEAELCAQPHPYQFRVVPEMGCAAPLLAGRLAQRPPYPVDALLFYHREGHYAFGRSPLLAQLKPYMLPELRPGVPRHDWLQWGRPLDYVDRLTDINAHEEAAQTLRDDGVGAASIVASIVASSAASSAAPRPPLKESPVAAPPTKRSPGARGGRGAAATAGGWKPCPVAAPGRGQRGRCDGRGRVAGPGYGWSGVPAGGNYHSPGGHRWRTDEYWQPAVTSVPVSHLLMIKDSTLLMMNKLAVGTNSSASEYEDGAGDTTAAGGAVDDGADGQVADREP